MGWDGVVIGEEDHVLNQADALTKNRNIISNQGIYGRLACCYLGILLLDCIYCVNELCLFHPQNLTLNG